MRYPNYNEHQQRKAEADEAARVGGIKALGGSKERPAVTITASADAESARKWRLAQLQTMIDYFEADRLDDLPLDEAGKVIPSREALQKVEAESRKK